MLCTPTICNVAFTKTLIDGGAGLNLLSVEAFNILHVPLERLSLSKPFSGVGGGTACSLGQIRLPVTFGTRDNNRTELVEFDIARWLAPVPRIILVPHAVPTHYLGLRHRIRRVSSTYPRISLGSCAFHLCPGPHAILL